MDLADQFTFEPPNAKYDQRVKKHQWDGKIRLLNKATRLIYSGLKNKIVEWAEARNLIVEVAPKGEEYHYEDFSLEAVLNPRMEARDYQRQLFDKAIEERRGTIISPTASGKSIMLYLMTRYWNRQTLIIVPTINLVDQLHADFWQYARGTRWVIGPHASDNWTQMCVGRIYGGVDPIGAVAHNTVLISTWQSLIDISPGFFEQFECVIVDECHGAKAKSLTKIMSLCINAKLRYGFTGTTDEIEVHELVLEGLFGPFIQNRTTSQLVLEGYLSVPKIRCIVLEYSEADKKALKALQRGTRAKEKYDIETNFIVNHQRRQNVLLNITDELDGSSFILFRLINHGKRIYESVLQKRPCSFVYGGTDGEDREAIRVDSDLNQDSLVVASYGVFSTGVNVPNLRNVVFASPYKSKIKVLQSIGRALRKTPTKDQAIIYDIVDDLTIDDKPNYAVRHYIERMKLYAKENFKVQTVKVSL